MELTIKLNVPNQEQEAEWLKNYFIEHNEPNINVTLLEKPVLEGTLDGGIFSGLLNLSITEGVKASIGLFFGIMLKYFDGRVAEFELSGKCPDNGKEFVLKFKNTTQNSREKMQEEFNKMYSSICNPNQEKNEK